MVFVITSYSIHYTKLYEAAQELGKRKPTPPQELAQLLATYNFPGNVRELRAMVYDAVSAHQGRVLSMESFRRAIGRQETAPPAPAATTNLFAAAERLPSLGEAGNLLVAEAMRRAQGNQTLAARLLGISLV